MIISVMIWIMISSFSFLVIASLFLFLHHNDYLDVIFAVHQILSTSFLFQFLFQDTIRVFVVVFIYFFLFSFPEFVVMTNSVCFD